MLDATMKVLLLIALVVFAGIVLLLMIPRQPAEIETTVTHIGVYGKMAARDQTTIGAYRQSMV